MRGRHAGHAWATYCPRFFFNSSGLGAPYTRLHFFGTGGPVVRGDEEAAMVGGCPCPLRNVVAAVEARFREAGSFVDLGEFAPKLRLGGVDWYGVGEQATACA